MRPLKKKKGWWCAADGRVPQLKPQQCKIKKKKRVGE
jgi:hypothetical protein